MIEKCRGCLNLLKLLLTKQARKIYTGLDDSTFRTTARIAAMAGCTINEASTRLLRLQKLGMVELIRDGRKHTWRRIPYADIVAD
jgi:hypothetical protein